MLSSSYLTLDAYTARLFRLLGLHPGPDATVAAVASLTDATQETVRPLLDGLTHAHLVTERVPGRYGFHDLLPAYAAELGLALDSDTDREEARVRLYDHYLHTARAADLLIDPHRLARPAELTPPRPGTRTEEPADHMQALRWMAAEHPVLLGLVRQAADAGHDGHRGPLHRALGDRYDEGEVLTHLGDTHEALGDRLAARTAWRQALDVYDEIGHPDAEQLRNKLDK